MNLLLWTLVVPLVSAAIGGLGGPRPFKEATMAGGLALRSRVSGTANSFLEEDPGRVGDACVLTGCPRGPRAVRICWLLSGSTASVSAPQRVARLVTARMRREFFRLIRVRVAMPLDPFPKTRHHVNRVG